MEISERIICLAHPLRLAAGPLPRHPFDSTELTDDTSLRVITPVRIYNLRGRTEVQPGKAPPRKRDPVLVNALRRAHAMVDLDSRRLPVCRTSPETQYGRRLIRLAFLAPDLQDAILTGTQPADLTLEQLIATPIPVDWEAQRSLFV